MPGGDPDSGERSALRDIVRRGNRHAQDAPAGVDPDLRGHAALRRNLETWEIVEQVQIVRRSLDRSAGQRLHLCFRKRLGGLQRLRQL